MEPFKIAIVGVTMVAGVGLIAIAAIALLKNFGAEAKGALALGPVKVEGTGAPAVFLLVGAAMLLSGFTWATTESDRKEAVTALGQLDRAYEHQVQLTRTLAAEAPTAVGRLDPQARAAIARRTIELSPKLKQAISRQTASGLAAAPAR